jgi:Tol biopolymer transport system component/tRNA A-37 threonylcarbamoyl transferase component Bud32
LLNPGTKLGAYEVVGAIGAGGMGEVYRARDMKLGREVALKVLPEALAGDAERIGRFQREAKVLASLNHPNIASIYGFEDSGGVHALVMELVEGQTLAERIGGAGAKGSGTAGVGLKAGAIGGGRHAAMPVDEALPVAKQICEGLEYAHERGIVHRDLKPANVKITPDGAVKLLDFGLAKALEGDGATASDPSSSPTMSRLATQAGIILGTAAYMSPEQAKGRPVDRRADIWAFGCVLYEMLTGHKPFDGETITDILASVVKEEPDWALLPPNTPLAIRSLLLRCLQKDPKRRLQAIGEARIAIEETLSGVSQDSPSTAPAAAAAVPVPRWRQAAPWLLAALAVVVGAFAVAHYRTAPAPAPVMRFTLAPPAGGEFATHVGAAAVLSPDGTRMAYVLQKGEQSQLYVRNLDQSQASPLPGTEGATIPFFSPDGRWVAFFAEGKLKKIAVTGGAPVTLCDAADARGGDWGPDNTILFTPTPNSPIERVSANGGTPETVTKLSEAPEPDSRSHRWPSFLPGEKQALFNVVYHAGNPLDHSDIAVDSLVTGKYQILIHGGSYPRYVPGGYIVYVAGTDMLAVPFDASSLRVTGPPVTIIHGVETQPYSGGAEYSFSESGTLLYLPKSSQPTPKSRLVWVDRKGAVQLITSTEHVYASPRVTPDGKRIVVEIHDTSPGISIYDVTRNTLGPLATEGSDGGPVLTPDGQSVIYDSVRNGSEGLWMRRVDGSGGEQNFTATTMLQDPGSVSPDGKLLAYTQGTATQSVLMVLPLLGNHTPRPLLPGPGNRAAAAFSPDGRWIAYVSDESGQNEVYVAAASGQGGKWQISSGGGTEPLWGRSGHELFYRSGNKMMAVVVSTGITFSAAKPRELFEGDFAHRGGPTSRARALPPDYDVSPDGLKFLMVQPVGPATITAPPGLHVVLNWFRELQATAQGQQ